MIKQICTDLETSKKLKELGFEAETEFYYTPTYITTNEKRHLELQYWHDATRHSAWQISTLIKAYTLEQVLSKLPELIEHSFHYYTLNFNYTEEYIEYKRNIEYKPINDEPYTEDKVLICQIRDIRENWATTAAKLWIKLKESEII